MASPLPFRSRWHNEQERWAAIERAKSWAAEQERLRSIMQYDDGFFRNEFAKLDAEQLATVKHDIPKWLADDAVPARKPETSFTSDTTNLETHWVIKYATLPIVLSVLFAVIAKLLGA